MAHLLFQISRNGLRSITKVCVKERLRSQLKIAELGFSRTIKTTSILTAEKRFTNSHEWVVVDDKIATVGVSEYAQDALGDVVYVQLPQVGLDVKKNEEVGALESVKAVSEIMSPVSGKIIAKNETVESKPALINTSPYEDGWLFKIEMANESEIKTLMDEKSYEEFLKTDAH